MPSTDRVPVLAFLAAVLLVAMVGGTAAGSPTPTAVCVVCGQTFHEDVTGTDATLQVLADGDVHWRVENELAEPTASEWRENPERAETRVREAVDSRFRHPHDPTEPTVTVEGNSVVIEFVDRDAARHRLGVLVVPYLHGEGVEALYAINADEFAIVAPEGQRIVNKPAGATVEGDRAVWSGVASTAEGTRGAETWDAPQPSDTYVVIGTGATAGTRSSIVTALEPLDPGLYGLYLLGLLFVAGASFGIYTVQGTRLGPRRVAAGVSVAVFPYLALVVSLHPPQFGGLGGFFTMLMVVIVTTLLVLLVGATLYTWAAIADRAVEVDTT